MGRHVTACSFLGSTRQPDRTLGANRDLLIVVPRPATCRGVLLHGRSWHRPFRPDSHESDTALSYAVKRDSGLRLMTYEVKFDWQRQDCQTPREAADSAMSG